MLFEDIIRGIRLQLNMTQEQLARELNISFSTINRWENGHTTSQQVGQDASPGLLLQEGHRCSHHIRDRETLALRGHGSISK